MIGELQISEPYRDRQTQFTGLLKADDWQFKQYVIQHPQNRADMARAEAAVPLQVESCLPRSEGIRSGYGVGYTILHLGRDANIIVVNWWAKENQLCSYHFQSSLADPYSFREITAEGPTVCVWDALVHAHERNAWVKLVLSSPQAASVDSYLKDVIEIRT